jgi:hypothetical protein
LAALPKSKKGKILSLYSVYKHMLTDGDLDAAGLEIRKRRAKEVELHAVKHYQRKYGADKVDYQKTSRTTRKRPDIAIRG